MLEHNEKYGVVLGFDVPVTRDAQELADSFKPPIKVWLIVILVQFYKWFFLDFHGRYHLSPDRSIYETFNRPKEEKTRRIETCCDISSITFNLTELRFRKKRSNYCWCQSKRRTTQNWFAHLRPCQSKIKYSLIHEICDEFSWLKNETEQENHNDSYCFIKRAPSIIPGFHTVWLIQYESY